MNMRVSVQLDVCDSRMAKALNTSILGDVVVDRAGRMAADVFIPYQRRWVNGAGCPRHRAAVNPQAAPALIPVIDPPGDVPDGHSRLAMREIPADRVPLLGAELRIGPPPA